MVISDVEIPINIKKKMNFHKLKLTPSIKSNTAIPDANNIPLKKAPFNIDLVRVFILN